MNQDNQTGLLFGKKLGVKPFADNQANIHRQVTSNKLKLAKQLQTTFSKTAYQDLFDLLGTEQLQKDTAFEKAIGFTSWNGSKASTEIIASKAINDSHAFNYMSMTAHELVCNAESIIIKRIQQEYANKILEFVETLDHSQTRNLVFDEFPEAIFDGVAKTQFGSDIFRIVSEAWKTLILEWLSSEDKTMQDTLYRLSGISRTI